MALPKLCTDLSAYQLIEEAEIPEFEGCAYVLRHLQSGAQLCCVKNNDPDKAFALGFKTPPANSTGVFHILEHSVLNGSRKFPTHEPFAHLLKSSMQTFLNAFTGCDFTMYPASSTNQQDLMNLLDVYMDAVFHPLLLEKEEVFLQEGWHYEVDEESGQLIVNGVVYNEMQGASAGASSRAALVLGQELFPDTAYGFSSGGDPSCIPTLTYEAYKDSYLRHYRPDRCWILLYGDMDYQQVLDFIDQEYLSPVAAEREGLAAQDPNPLDLQKPCISVNRVHPFDSTDEQVSYALGFVDPASPSIVREYACSALLQALLGNNQSPLRRKLVEAGVGEDVVLGDLGSQLQPAYSLLFTGAHKLSKEEIFPAFWLACQEVLDEGISWELLDSALCYFELLTRQHKGKMQGIMIGLTDFVYWMVSDHIDISTLRYEECFARLHEMVDTHDGYFEELFRQLFVENQHYAFVELVPTNAAEDELNVKGQQFVNQAAEAMGPQGLEQVAEKAQWLRDLQEQPDDPAALATLPHLSLQDISTPPTAPAYHELCRDGIKYVRFDMSTGGIAYATRCYDLTGLTQEELRLLRILVSVQTKIGTRRHEAAEALPAIQKYLGYIDSSLIYGVKENAKAGTREPVMSFQVRTRSLPSHADKLASFVSEILLESKVEDLDAFSLAFKQHVGALERNLPDQAGSLAQCRARAQQNTSGRILELFEGVDSLRFLKKTADDIEDADKSASLAAQLAAVAYKVYAHCPQVIAFAGPEEAFEVFHESELTYRAQYPAPALEELAQQLDANSPTLVSLEPLEKEAEAFSFSSQVAANCCALDMRPHIKNHTLLWEAGNLLSKNLLWDEIRVKGGAYHSRFGITREGIATFLSSSDPNIDTSYACFEAAATWLEAYDPQQQDFDDLIISIVGALDAPQAPFERLNLQLNDYLFGRSPSDRLEQRERVLESTVEDIHRCGAFLKDVAASASYCTLAGEDALEASSRSWKKESLL